MTMAAKGVAKLIEECGELQQVLGKKLAWWDTDEPHWDGSVLNDRVAEEMGDVLAAIYFVAHRLGLDMDMIYERSAAKTAQFREWDDDIGNNEHGVDGLKPPRPEQLPYVIIPEGSTGVVMWSGAGWIHVGTEPPA